MLELSEISRISCCFCYYGISLNALSIAGTNRYVSFMIVVSVEIPSVLLAMPLINRMKRRVLLFSTLFVAAISITATSIVPEDHSTIIIVFSMMGKGCITFAFTLLYVFTAEQWPTNLRTTIMNSCSMIGRTGSMVAPFVVILVRHLIADWLMKITKITTFHTIISSRAPNMVHFQLCYLVLQLSLPQV